MLVLACALLLAAIVFDRAVLDGFDLLSGMTLPLVLGGVLSAVLGYRVIPILQRLKTGQVVQEDGPQSHLKKAGTPTMGGIFFIPVAVVVCLSLTRFNFDAIAVCLVTLAYAWIGWFDDWQVLHKQSNKGISPRTKLSLQIAIAVLFCVWLWLDKFPEVSQIDLPVGITLSLGWLIFPLAGFVLAAESNATNLTDGVDGLAAGTSAIAFLGLGMLIFATSPSLAIFCAAMSGSCWGFLVHNHNPARVFMGDTGSLALGGALAAVGLVSGNLWTLFVVSGLFFVESLSVIAQVGYYKATKDETGKGKRLFKMAPIHHHFELSGWSETQVVGVFYLVSLLLCGAAYLIR